MPTKTPSPDDIRRAVEETAHLTVPRSDSTQPLDLTQVRDALAAHVYGSHEIAIVNALADESAAVHAVFGDSSKVPIQNGAQSYDVFTVRKTNGHDVRVAMVGVTEVGITQAAVAVALLAQRLSHIRHVLLIGIAAGQPDPTSAERDVCLGDIVVSERVVQYDHVKRVNGKITDYRGKSLPVPDPDFLRVARGLQARSTLKPGGAAAAIELRPWERYINRAASMIDRAERPAGTTDPMSPKRSYIDGDFHPRLSGRPHVHVGVIGSGNMLLRDAKFRDGLNKTFKTISYEMEGAGIAIAAGTFSVKYTVVRGITDYADQNKSDAWRRYSSIAAAAFARCMIEEL